MTSSLAGEARTLGVDFVDSPPRCSLTLRRSDAVDEDVFEYACN